MKGNANRELLFVQTAVTHYRVVITFGTSHAQVWARSKLLFILGL